MKEKKQATCHPDRPEKSKGLCRNCYEKQLLASNPEYKKRQIENSRNYAIKNVDKIKEYQRKRREKSGPQTDVKFFRYIKSKFSLSKEDYEKLVDRCGNKCEICDKPPYDKKRLHLDHDHKTNKVRGLLCARCNWYLHTVEKNPEVLNKIKKYLNYE